eukprot:765482-Hanusia_phi.AAC.2
MRCCEAVKESCSCRPRHEGPVREEEGRGWISVVSALCSHDLDKLMACCRYVMYANSWRPNVKQEEVIDDYSDAEVLLRRQQVCVEVGIHAVLQMNKLIDDEGNVLYDEYLDDVTFALCGSFFSERVPFRKRKAEARRSQFSHPRLKAITIQQPLADATLLGLRKVDHAE